MKHLDTFARFRKKEEAFTIVELLVVIVVIAILAAVVIVSYNGIANRAKENSLKTDLKNGATQLQVQKENSGSYPANTNNLQKANSTTFSQYRYTSNTFCLEVTDPALPATYFHMFSAGSIEDGLCPIATDGDYIQEVSNVSCPDARTRAVDARDNHTYWIQKLADGNCWMLTNLSYGGGGVNTYSDVKTLTNNTGGSPSFTSASYYIPTSGSNITVEPTAPSTSTDGGTTNPQYGYLYNWCGAMGGQVSAACANSSTPSANTQVSVCPSGWRLPTGGPNGEIVTLNNAINSGSTSSDAGLRTDWLIQRSGYWIGGFAQLGTRGGYWTSTQLGTDTAEDLYFHASNVSLQDVTSKYYGYGIRCIAKQ